MLFLLLSKNRKLALQIISGILLFQCVIVGGIGFYFYNTINDFLSNSLRAQGTVIALVQSSGTSYYPEITFKDNTGKMATFSSKSSNPSSYIKGDKVTVLYDADNPSNARIDRFSTLWLVPVVCIIVSVFALIASIGFGIWSRSASQ